VAPRRKILPVTSVHPESAPAHRTIDSPVPRYPDTGGFAVRGEAGDDICAPRPRRVARRTHRHGGREGMAVVVAPARGNWRGRVVVVVGGSRCSVYNMCVRACQCNSYANICRGIGSRTAGHPRPSSFSSSPTRRVTESSSLLAIYLWRLTCTDTVSRCSCPAARRSSPRPIPLWAPGPR
jgi:hypothetical protein